MLTSILLEFLQRASENHRELAQQMEAAVVQWRQIDGCSHRSPYKTYDEIALCMLPTV